MQQIRPHVNAFANIMQRERDGAMAENVALRERYRKREERQQVLGELDYHQGYLDRQREEADQNAEDDVDEARSGSEDGGGVAIFGAAIRGDGGVVAEQACAAAAEPRRPDISNRGSQLGSGHSRDREQNSRPGRGNHGESPQDRRRDVFHGRSRGGIYKSHSRGRGGRGRSRGNH